MQLLSCRLRQVRLHRDLELQFGPQLTVVAGPNEAGKIIGRNGRVAKSIRDIMAVAAARQGKRVHIDIE
jgi:predicted RNA-binding protein YlqC (UPF0109 family)